MPASEQPALIPRHDPAAEGAIVLWKPKRGEEHRDVAIVVDPYLGSRLRPHQVDGVRFLFNAISRRRYWLYFKFVSNFYLFTNMFFFRSKVVLFLQMKWVLVKSSFLLFFFFSIFKIGIVKLSFLFLFLQTNDKNKKEKLYKQLHCCGLF